MMSLPQNLQGLNEVMVSLQDIKEVTEILKQTPARAEALNIYKEKCLELVNYINNLISTGDSFHLLRSASTRSNDGVQRALAVLREALHKAYSLVVNCGRALTISSVLPKGVAAVKELEEEIRESVSLLSQALKAHNIRESTSAGHSFSISLGQSSQNILAVDRSQVTIIQPVASTLPSTSTSTSRWIPSKSFSVACGVDKRHWLYTTRKGSTFDEVLCLDEVCHLDVRVQVDINTLEPGTYSIMWRYQVTCLDDCWETTPVTFKVSEFEGRDLLERPMFLCPGAASRFVGDIWSCVIEVIGGNTDVQLCSKNASSSSAILSWVEYPIHNFTVEGGQKNPQLVFSMSELGSHWKRGLVLDAVFIKQISKMCFHSSYDRDYA